MSMTNALVAMMATPMSSGSIKLLNESVCKLLSDTQQKFLLDEVAQPNIAFYQFLRDIAALCVIAKGGDETNATKSALQLAAMLLPLLREQVNANTELLGGYLEKVTSVLEAHLVTSIVDATGLPQKEMRLFINDIMSVLEGEDIQKIIKTPEHAMSLFLERVDGAAEIIQNLLLERIRAKLREMEYDSELANEAAESIYDEIVTDDLVTEFTHNPGRAVQRIIIGFMRSIDSDEERLIKFGVAFLKKGVNYVLFRQLGLTKSDQFKDCVTNLLGDIVRDPKLLRDVVALCATVEGEGESDTKKSALQLAVVILPQFRKQSIANTALLSGFLQEFETRIKDLLLELFRSALVGKGVNSELVEEAAKFVSSTLQDDDLVTDFAHHPGRAVQRFISKFIDSIADDEERMVKFGVALLDEGVDYVLYQKLGFKENDQFKDCVRKLLRDISRDAKLLREIAALCAAAEGEDGTVATKSAWQLAAMLLPSFQRHASANTALLDEFKTRTQDHLVDSIVDVTGLPESETRSFIKDVTGMLEFEDVKKIIETPELATSLLLELGDGAVLIMRNLLLERVRVALSKKGVDAELVDEAATFVSNALQDDDIVMNLAHHPGRAVQRLIVGFIDSIASNNPELMVRFGVSFLSKGVHYVLFIKLGLKECEQLKECVSRLLGHIALDPKLLRDIAALCAAAEEEGGADATKSALQLAAMLLPRFREQASANTALLQSYLGELAATMLVEYFGVEAEVAQKVAAQLPPLEYFREGSTTSGPSSALFDFARKLFELGLTTEHAEEIKVVGVAIFKQVFPLHLHAASILTNCMCDRKKTAELLLRFHPSEELVRVFESLCHHLLADVDTIDLDDPVGTLKQCMAEIVARGAQEAWEVVENLVLVVLCDFGVERSDAKMLSDSIKDHMMCTKGAIEIEMVLSPQTLCETVLQKALSEARLQKTSLGSSENTCRVVSCAKSVLTQMLARQLEQRGFDARVRWLVQEAITSIPVDELLSALRDPDRFAQSILKRAFAGGMDFAAEMLEGAVEEASKCAVAKLVAAGVPEEFASHVVEQPEGASAEDVIATASEVVELSPDEMLSKMRDELSSMSAVSGLAAAAFFLKDRCLPLYDVASDVLIAMQIYGCTEGGETTMLCAGAAFTEAEAWRCDYNEDEALIFFQASIAFLLLTWCPLWLAVWNHVLTVAREKADAKFITTALLKAVFSIDVDNLDFKFLPGLLFLLLAFDLPGLALMLPHWLLKSTCNRKRPNFGDLFDDHRNIGACMIWNIYGLLLLIIGAPLLALVEIGMLLLSPHQQTRGSFSSSYENLKRVLEPAFEALPQGIIQVAFWVWLPKPPTGFEFDWLLLSSVSTSIWQIYRNFHFIKGLAQTRASLLPCPAIISQKRTYSRRICFLV
jgi:hypothetical protein